MNGINVSTGLVLLAVLALIMAGYWGYHGHAYDKLGRDDAAIWSYRFSRHWSIGSIVSSIASITITYV